MAGAGAATSDSAAAGSDAWLLPGAVELPTVRRVAPCGSCFTLDAAPAPLDEARPNAPGCRAPHPPGANAERRPALREPPSSSATPSTSSSSQARRSIPWSHRRRHPRLRPPWVLAVDSGASGHPRPRPRARWIRGELLHRSPFFSPSYPRRSAAPHHGRSLSPPSMSPSPSRPASAQTEPSIALPVPRGCRRAPQVASPCPAARSRSRPNSGRRPELCSGELRRPRSLPRVPLDARERGLRSRGLRRPNGRRSDDSEPLRRAVDRSTRTNPPPPDTDSGPRCPLTF